MRRSLLAGFLAAALAGVAAGQSGTQPDDTPPAAATPPAASEAPAAQPPQAPGSGEKAPDADAIPKPEATQEAPKDAPKEAPKAATKQADKPSEPEALAQCLRDWDAGTHMTRQEWARVCRRVVSQRLKFLRAEP